ncbi:HEAT repeat domain-containing protein [Algoriphagus sediminis]|uniref:HEAT repeat domain-containing protein n=1 Tax=Algoriphagus sediminis TaxID=3057113 RepID=A0ABT7YE69_9BACT|nr:HEAT repeat domain-containing protein [Algoriphagus sediminis]MDN3204494.1 HEAT repeat domain-containing protein [Algoriphagus sediminis]
MKESVSLKFLSPVLIGILLSCSEPSNLYEPQTKFLSKAEVDQYTEDISSKLNPTVHEDFELSIWAVDSLMNDAISIQVLDNGDVVYTHTNRQKNSEFDIRGHQDWEIRSISLQSIEDKRNFLRNELSPERSEVNSWLADLNGDGSHDWRDMLVEKEEIYRLKDTDGDGKADFQERLVEDFNEEVTDVAGAVMMTDEALYVGAGPDLWKLVDTNGDGMIDEKESLSHGYGIHIGFGAHGMSGLEMGPDGRIYWGIGDIGFNGIGPDGTEWKYPNRGVIARANPDGSDFEIFAMGVRNTHEFVFDQYNNLISVDNDGDHPGEKERLVYLTNGSDSGWRTNWQFGKYRDPDNNPYKVWMDEKLFTPRWEEQAAFITPCIANYVSGPTGMVYNPGTALNEKYFNNFFVVEFVGNPTQSAIHAFTLKPKGATFELEKTEKIATGVLPTGMDFSADGDLYFADWIMGWGTKGYGRMWKMESKSKSLQAIQEETKELLNSDFGPKNDSELQTLLEHQDLRVRRKSQFELAKRGGKGATVFENVLNTSSNQLARIHSIVGLSQLARLDDIKYAKLILPALSDEDPEIRAQGAKWIGDIRYKEPADALLKLLDDTKIRVQFFAAEALGRISYSDAADKLIEVLRRNNDEDAYLRHAATLALARIGNESMLASLYNDPSRAVRMGAVISLRRLTSPELRRFLNDEDELIVTEAARAIHDDFSVPEALPDLAALINTTPFSNEPLMRRIISANQRVGSEKEFDQVLNFVQASNSTIGLQEEGIESIGTWAKPSLVDRVDGRYRGEVNRNDSYIAEKAGEALVAQLGRNEEAIRIASAKAIGKLKIKGAENALLASLKNDPSMDMKVQSLRSLQAIKSNLLPEGVEYAMSSSDYPIRVEALAMIEEIDIPDEQKIALLMDIIENQTNVEKRSALLALGKMEGSSSFSEWNDIFSWFKTDQLSQPVWVELEEAVGLTGSENLMSSFSNLLAEKAGDEDWKMYSGALAQGDPRLGRAIFLENQTAQCIRCHAYDDMGGNAGPNLNGIARKLSREELLISLVDPSDRIAPGFGQVRIVKSDGEEISGTYISETDEGIRYLNDSNEEILVDSELIESSTLSMSSMPPMGLILTKRQLRDVVAYLGTLNSEE